MLETNPSWEHIKTILDSEPFYLNGISIWAAEWKKTNETAHVKDPIYHQDFAFAVYEIAGDETTLRFAAGEFSNRVWGIYQEALR